MDGSAVGAGLSAVNNGLCISHQRPVSPSVRPSVRRDWNRAASNDAWVPIAEQPMRRSIPTTRWLIPIFIVDSIRWLVTVQHDKLVVSVRRYTLGKVAKADLCRLWSFFGRMSEWRNYCRVRILLNTVQAENQTDESSSMITQSQRWWMGITEFRAVIFNWKMTWSMALGCSDRWQCYNWMIEIVRHTHSIH